MCACDSRAILQGKECEKTVLEVVSLNKASVEAIDKREEREITVAHTQENNVTPTQKQVALTPQEERIFQNLMNAIPFEHGEPSRAKMKTIKKPKPYPPFPFLGLDQS